MSWKLTLFFCLTLPSAVSAQPATVRLAVIDNSGSMSGERCATVRSELAKLAADLPPSKDHPFALILFGTKAQTVQVFTEASPFQRALEKVNGDGGGTSIAGGLLEAHRYLATIQDRSQLQLFLFSDGEDSDTRGIDAAEEKLGNLLSAHSQTTGLRNSVFVKRWGGANAELLRRLAARPGIDLFDAQGSSSTLTMTPRLTIQKSEMLVGGKGIELTLIPSFEAPAVPPGVRLPKIQYSLKTPGLEMAPFQVEAASPPRAVKATVKFPDPAQVASLREIEFVAAPVADKTSGAGLVLVQLAQPVVTLPVQWSRPELRNRVVATLDFYQAPRWSDPIRLRAVYPLKIAFDVSAGDANKGEDRSASFSIEPLGNTRIVSGQPSFTLPGPGKFDVMLELELSPVDASKSSSQPQFGFGLTIKPIRLPPNLRFEPPQLQIRREDLAPPDPVKVVIQGAVLATTPARWVAWPNVASCDALIRLSAKGPIPPGTTFRLEHGLEIQRVAFAPQTLAHQDQMVAVRLLAPFPAAPAKSRFPLRLKIETAPNRYSPFQFDTSRPVEIVVAGPRPAELRGSVQQGGQGEGCLTVWDNAKVIPLRMTPILAGPVHPDFLRDVNVRFSTREGAACVGRLQELACLDVPVSSSGQRSFFFDTPEVIDVAISPAQPNEAIRPGTIRWRVIHLAPFRRLLTWLTTGLASCLALFLLVRTVNRLTAKGA